MNFLSHAAQSLATTAKSPLAFVAYIFTTAVWAWTWDRSRRLKTLHAGLSHVPEAQRPGYIRAMLGDVVPGSINVDDWLRSKRQRYRFLAYLALLFLVLCLAGIAAYREWLRRNSKTNIPELQVNGPTSVGGGSVIISQIQKGGQVAHSITNIGSQPRTISEAAVEELVTRLKDHPKESFDILVNNDPEALRFKDQVKAALTKAGWTLKDESIDLVNSREPGAVIHVQRSNASRPQVTNLLEWFNEHGFLKYCKRWDSAERVRIDIGSNL